MPKKTYEDLSPEELEAVSQDLDSQIAALREEKAAVSSILDAKLVEAEAVRKFDRMSTGERRALLQVMELRGIESEEA